MERGREGGGGRLRERRGKEREEGKKGRESEEGKVEGE